MRSILLILIYFTISTLIAQNNVLEYTLTHNEKSKNVTVTIEFDSINTAKQYLQIPRSAPGTYDISDYPSFIENIKAITLNDSVIQV